MLKKLPIMLVVLVTGKCLAVQVSYNDPSFDCSQAGNKVEGLICEKNSYHLKRLDNRMSLEYSLLLSNVNDSHQIKKQQKKWIKSRNSCDTKDCIQLSYKNRLVEIRKQLITIYKKNKTSCFTNPYEAIFKDLSEYENTDVAASKMSLGYASSDGGGIDLDLDNVADPLLRVELNGEACRATNCWSGGKVFLNIDGCYKGVGVAFNRSYSAPAELLEKRIYDVYIKKNIKKGIAVLISYNVSGCAGSSGTKYFSGLNSTTMNFETFASIEYECEKETGFWIKGQAK